MTTYARTLSLAVLSSVGALYGVYVSTLAIETVTQGAADELFAHESAGGVRQTCEIGARLLADVVSWSILPLVYALPLAALANFGAATTVDVIGILYFLQWAMQPIGYLLTVLYRPNATVAVSSVALVVTIFLNSQLGPSLKTAPRLLALSPARWATGALCLTYITHRPFSRVRAVLEDAMLHTGVIPGAYDLRALPDGREQMLANMRTVVSYSKHSMLQSQLTFCAGVLPAPANASTAANVSADLPPLPVAIAEEYESISEAGWYGEALLALFLTGLILRLLAIALFYKRSRAWATVPIAGAVAARLEALMAAVCGSLGRMLRGRGMGRAAKDAELEDDETPSPGMLLAAQRLPPPGTSGTGGEGGRAEQLDWQPAGSQLDEGSPSGVLAWLSSVLADDPPPATPTKQTRAQKRAQKAGSPGAAERVCRAGHTKLDRSLSKLKLRPTNRSHKLTHRGTGDQQSTSTHKEKPPSNRRPSGTPSAGEPAGTCSQRI